MKEKRDLFIIIVTYNGISWIEKCLKSAQPYNIIVVDNNSGDGTINLIKQKFPEVTLIPLNENLGFGKANNLGISRALEIGAQEIFLLNQDAYLEDTTLEILSDSLKKNPEYGIVSPIHLNGKGEKLDPLFSHYISYKFNKRFISDHVLNKLKEEIYEVPFVNAAGWLISRKCLQEVGGFDPIFFHYGEDDNYCQRLRYHGFRIGVSSGSFLRHDKEEGEEVQNQLRDDPFLRLERQWKIYYGDINKKREEELLKLMNNKRKSWIRTSIKFHSSSRRYKREFELLQKISPDILASRTKNKTKAPHYL